MKVAHTCSWLRSLVPLVVTLLLAMLTSCQPGDLNANAEAIEVDLEAAALISLEAAPVPVDGIPDSVHWSPGPAQMLDSSRLVVSDTSSGRLLMWDGSNWDYVTRYGVGVGETTEITSLSLWDGELHVHNDAAPSRVLVFDALGGFRRTVTVSARFSQLLRASWGYVGVRPFPEVLSDETPDMESLIYGFGPNTSDFGSGYIWKAVSRLNQKIDIPETLWAFGSDVLIGVGLDAIFVTHRFQNYLIELNASGEICATTLFEDPSFREVRSADQLAGSHRINQSIAIDAERGLVYIGKAVVGSLGGTGRVDVYDVESGEIHVVVLDSFPSSLAYGQDMLVVSDNHVTNSVRLYDLRPFLNHLAAE